MFVKKLIDQNSSLLNKIYAHQFNINLFSGKLHRDIFRNYLEQDRLYLLDYAKALQIFAQRLTHEGHAQTFRRYATETVMLEQAIQAKYLQKLSPSTFFAEKPQQVNKSRVIKAYTEHLLEMAENAPIEVAVVCFIACFWIYKELGEQMSVTIDDPSQKEEHPYWDWISTYSDVSFKESTLEMMSIAEEIIEEVKKGEAWALLSEQIAACFSKSVRFEYDFFEETFPSQQVDSEAEIAFNTLLALG